jgi:hypothetical protein
MHSKSAARRPSGPTLPRSDICVNPVVEGLPAAAPRTMAACRWPGPPASSAKALSTYMGSVFVRHRRSAVSKVASSSLADKVALRTSDYTIEEIASQIAEVVAAPE